MRYFRANDAAIYESLRLRLDAEFGFPTEDGSTVTCLPPAGAAPRDSIGRILLAAWPEFCEIAAVAAVLPSLLASGVVAEISESQYAPVSRDS